jgi:hypothetical protein
VTRLCLQRLAIAVVLVLALISFVGRSLAQQPPTIWASGLTQEQAAQRGLEYLPLAEAAYNPGTAPSGWTYAGNATDLIKQGWLDSSIVEAQAAISGFKASVFSRPKPDGSGTEYVFAFAGTDGVGAPGDWYTNYQNFKGLPTTQYTLASQIAQAAQQRYGEVTFVGHSLGGGLAQQATLVTGQKGIGFNAAGYSYAKAERPDLSEQFLALNSDWDLAANSGHQLGTEYRYPGNALCHALGCLGELLKSAADGTSPQSTETAASPQDQYEAFASNYKDFVDTTIDATVGYAAASAEWAKNTKLANSLNRSATIFSGAVAGLLEIPEIYLGGQRDGWRGYAREAAGAAVAVGLDVAGSYACGALATAAGATSTVGAPVVFGATFFACQYVAGKVADVTEKVVESGIDKLLGTANAAGAASGAGGAQPFGRRGNGPVRIGNFNAIVNTGDVTNSAVGSGARAETDIATARGGDGGNVDLRATTGTVTTTARGRNSQAYTSIGSADGSSRSTTITGTVSTTARSGETASTEIGKVSGGGRANVRTGDVVTTGNASNTIGAADGGDANVRTGDVVTSGKRGGASTNIGSGGSTAVGDVINSGGSLSIGGGVCVGRRNGQCCIQFHRGYCTTRIVPTYKGQCPPRYERWGGLCYLYSDKQHSVGR